MRRKSILYLLLVVVLCNIINVQDGYAVSKKKKIGFAKKNITITAGKKTNLKFKNPTNKVKWSVSNKKVVKLVKKKGNKKNIAVLKGLKKGKCKITARCGGKKYSIKVIVKQKTTNKVTGETINAKAVKNKILITENLEIQLETNGNKTYYFDESPGKLEKNVGDKWVEIKQKENIKWREISFVLSHNQKQKLVVPINAYYENVTSGQYRYIKKIGGKDIIVEFEIDLN